MQRTCEMLSELCGCEVSEGTPAGWVDFAPEALSPIMEQIAQGVLASPIQHCDEPGVRLFGKLHWMHVNSTRFLTHLAWHRKQEREALEAIGIWPRYRGRSMHDRWASFDRYCCLHSVCGAHVVRDLTYEHEHQNQPILDGFEDWLKQAGMSETTIKDHMDNILFFTRYLVLYEHSLRRLDEATEGDVYDFLSDWFPRKALWASIASMRVYLASFKKFFKWMRETGLVSPETVEDVLSTLKDSRNEFLRKVAE